MGTHAHTCDAIIMIFGTNNEERKLKINSNFSIKIGMMKFIIKKNVWEGICYSGVCTEINKIRELYVQKQQKHC